MHRPRSERERGSAQERFAKKKAVRQVKTLRYPKTSSAKAFVAEARVSKRTGKPERWAYAETAFTEAGLNVDDFVRPAHHAVTPSDTGTTPVEHSPISEGSRARTTPPYSTATAFATGVSYPDEDERLPMHVKKVTLASSPAAPAAIAPRPVRIVLAKAMPQQAMSALATRSEPQPSTEVVNASSTGVHLHAPSGVSAEPTAVVLHETSAHEELDWSEATHGTGKPMLVPLYARRRAPAARASQGQPRRIRASEREIRR